MDKMGVKYEVRIEATDTVFCASTRDDLRSALRFAEGVFADDVVRRVFAIDGDGAEREFNQQELDWFLDEDGRYNGGRGISVRWVQ